ncbi:MAG: aldo/keto reductase [Planctomycetes bacterium]|nr:aldo/keto reductase [Planctomycetota bacterium]
MSDQAIKNYNKNMAYRRFGKTELMLSCITLGGMRYVDGWGEPRDEPSTAMVDQCARITRMALDHGINHIETAHGYGKSEHCYGKALNDVLQLPRESYHLMTKGQADTAADMRRLVEEQLTALRTDHFDLYAWHGINTDEKLDISCASGGPVEELLKMQEEGIIGSVGFSTHAPLEIIIDALATELFSFVNLHYYYFLQRNRGAVDYAAAKDYGVFIISPNDKGGKLYDASDKLKELCAPLTPIQFNAKWCLKHPQIQTLSFGLSEEEQYQEFDGMFPIHVPLSKEELEIECRMNNALLEDPISAYEGFELIKNQPNINVPEILRHRRMAKCYGQESFGYMRYNMFQDKGDWFPGAFAMPEAVADLDTSVSPVELDVQALLNETHAKFYQPKEETAEG